MFSSQQDGSTSCQSVLYAAIANRVDQQGARVYTGALPVRFSCL